MKTLQEFTSKFGIRSMSMMARENESEHALPDSPTNKAPANNAWKNMLMWGHYADSHKGLCIGYQFHQEFFQRHKNAFIQKFNIKKKLSIINRILYGKTGY